MALRAKNFVDKSFWNAANVAINNVNVATPGEVNAFFAAQGLNINYGSQDDLGKRVCIAEADALSYSLTTVGTLFGGIYQLVQVSASATAANVATGKCAFTLDGVSNAGAQGYVVTDEAHATALGLIGGIFLNSITPGNFGFVQVHGKASVLYNGAVTDATVGDIVLPKGAGDGTFDSLALATATTDLVLAKFVGIAIQQPVISVLKTIQMRPLFGRY